jgi:tRNA(Ile2) C34 agmatinyltransferase TiaS
MGTLILDRRTPRHRDIEDQGQHADTYVAHVDVHGRLTLDDLISSVWEGLTMHIRVRCPTCGGEMSSIGDSADGLCLGCGSRLQ